MSNTIGVFHRIPSTIKFDPAEVANKLACHKGFYSDQHWDVRAFTYEGTQPTGAPEYARLDINKLIADGHTDGFDPRFRHILGGHKASGRSCGQAEYGGRGDHAESVTFDEHGCDGDTPCHELTHSGLGDGTGIGHSHELRKHGKIGKMEDWSSLMGSGTAEGLISPYICVLGWNRPSETIVITDTASVLIAPTEMAGLHPNEFKHCIVRIPGFNDFYLHTRQAYPFDLGDDRDVGRLFIHELFPEGHPDVAGDYGNATLLHERLEVGENMVLPNGMTVRYLEWIEGIATVEIEMEERT